MTQNKIDERVKEIEKEIKDFEESVKFKGKIQFSMGTSEEWDIYHDNKIKLKGLLEGAKLAREEIIEKIKSFQIELLKIVDDCVSDWTYIEREYNKKFEELINQINNQNSATKEQEK